MPTWWRVGHDAWWEMSKVSQHKILMYGDYDDEQEDCMMEQIWAEDRGL